MTKLSFKRFNIVAFLEMNSNTKHWLSTYVKAHIKKFNRKILSFFIKKCRNIILMLLVRFLQNIKLFLRINFLFLISICVLRTNVRKTQ